MKGLQSGHATNNFFKEPRGVLTIGLAVDLGVDSNSQSPKVCMTRALY